MEFSKTFNRQRGSNNTSPNKTQINEDGSNQNNSVNDQQSVIANNISDTTIIQIIEKNGYAGPVLDEKISEEIEVIRKSRFYHDFDAAKASIALSRSLVRRELSGGSDSVKSKAIAWCSRFLLHSDLGEAEECLKLAKQLGSCPEIEIAEAFIYSQKGDKPTALSILANLNIPLSHSAALMIVANNEGAKAAVDWLGTVGIPVSDLDSDGKYFFLSLHFQLEQWGAALSRLDFVTDEDLRQTPALNQIMAITHLIGAVPSELRTGVLNQVPVHAASFPLAADTNAMEARRKARRFFISATEVAQQLSCYNSAKIFEEYALWLGLKDPSESKQTTESLKEKLRDSKSALRLVRLGIQFGIELDLRLVEGEIERQIALHGGITQDAAIARFAIAFMQKSPEDVANYVARHYDELAKYFDKKSLRFLEIEMLSQAGMPKRAKECFDLIMREGLSEAEENNLRTIIAEIGGTNPIETYKEQFRKTGALSDLMILVVELEAKDQLADLCEYSEIVFERTHSLRDAERLAIALSKTQKYERLVEFSKTNSEFLVQSKNLHMLYCWALYNEGALLEARTELSKLDNDDNPNYRLLQLNLAIALGDWNSLAAFVSKEYLEKEKRSAQELMGAAQLAHYLGYPYAKELTFAAVEKGNDDADILANAYFLASRAGWESSAEVCHWLNRAADLSGDKGPLQKKSLKDLLDMKPDWERRESETLQLLSRGDIPMFLAGESLNRSLVQMMLFPALANLSENDPRRKAIVPVHSGKRQLTPMKILGTVAMDPTVLLTLSLLKVLDKALDAFESVYVPHSTLIWLFEEKQKASFHQPSRIRDAHEIQRLLAKGILEKLISSNTVPDSNLSVQVGDELALLIAEAKKTSAGGNIHCIVVRPYPVYRISSLMMEAADLKEYATILSSCQAIVDKLRSRGQITIEEKNKAHAYLHIQEKSWPNQPEITDRAILYLDGLAITYFQHLGLLEKLKAAGFRLMVSPGELSEANGLTSYESISDQIDDAIEQIRSAVNRRIESGKIKVGKRRSLAEQEVQSISGNPTVELFALARESEAIFIDDRSLNQHVSLAEEGTQVQICSTQDLLDTLFSIGSISSSNLLEYRTILRRAGYCFVSINDFELIQHLNSSVVKDNKVIETAELKAIRENILFVRMSNWLQLPKEALWLDGLFKTFVSVLKGIWANESDFSSMRARSNWILSQIDVRGWAHCIGNEVGEKNVQVIRGKHVMLLLLPPAEASSKNKAEYWKWVEEMVLAPIKAEQPDLYVAIIDQFRREIARLVDMDLSRGGQHE